MLKDIIKGIKKRNKNLDIKIKNNKEYMVTDNLKTWEMSIIVTQVIDIPHA